MAEQKQNKELVWDFKIFSQKRIWFTALLLGIFLRIISAIYGYGPVAIDDYSNLIAPALEKIQTGAEIEIENYRMVFLGQLVYAVMYLPHQAGIDSPRVLVSLFYLTLGFLSLFLIWGGYKLAQNFIWQKDQQWFPYFILSLFALHFAMPFISTKAYIESLSMFFIPLAFYFLTKDKPYDLFWGSFWLSFSVLFRFQNGILIIVTAIFILYELVIKKKNFHHLLFFLAGGFLVLALMAGLDISSNRKPFSTIINYIVYNFDTNVASQIWGTSPWWTYLSILLLVFLPPLSLFLLPALWKGMKRSPLLAINLVVFVLFHSFIPNKIERFLFPVFPLFIFLTALGFLHQQKSKWQRWENKTMSLFLILNMPLVFFLSSSRPQMNIIKAASYMNIHPREHYYFYGSLNFWVQGYYGYQYPNLQTITDQNFPQILEKNKSIYVLSYEAQIFGKACQMKNKFSPDFGERLVILTNPEFNKRRDTLYLHQCTQENKESR